MGSDTGIEMISVGKLRQSEWRPVTACAPPFWKAHTKLENFILREKKLEFTARVLIRNEGRWR